MGDRSRRGSTGPGGLGGAPAASAACFPSSLTPSSEPPVLPTLLCPALPLGLPGASHLQPQTLSGLRLLQEAASVSTPSVRLLLSRRLPARKGDGSSAQGRTVEAGTSVLQGLPSRHRPRRSFQTLWLGASPARLTPYPLASPPPRSPHALPLPIIPLPSPPSLCPPKPSTSRHPLLASCPISAPMQPLVPTENHHNSSCAL